MKAVKNLFVLTSTMAALSASGMAFAEKVSSEFYVTIRIKPVCEVNADSGGAPTQPESTPSKGADIDFGEHFSNSKNNVEGSSKAGPSRGIEIKCTKGTAYKIALKPTSTSSETGDGRMNGLGAASADHIEYSLYQDSSYSKKWGSQEDNIKGGDGEGFASPIFHPVYGKVAGTELDKTAGRYIDRVAVEVSY